MKSTTIVFAAILGFTAGRSPAVAADGRDFAGGYSLTGVSEVDGRVALTLSLHLFNYTGTDLKQATVVVRGPRFGPILAKFQPITNWPNARDIVIRQSLTVAADTYRIWSSHSQPNVFVTYSTGDEQRQRPAELSRRPDIMDAPHETGR